MAKQQQPDYSAWADSIATPDKISANARNAGKIQTLYDEHADQSLKDDAFNYFRTDDFFSPYWNGAKRNLPQNIMGLYGFFDKFLSTANNNSSIIQKMRKGLDLIKEVMLTDDGKVDENKFDRLQMAIGKYGRADYTTFGSPWYNKRRVLENAKFSRWKGEDSNVQEFLKSVKIARRFAEQNNDYQGLVQIRKEFVNSLLKKQKSGSLSRFETTYLKATQGIMGAHVDAATLRGALTQTDRDNLTKYFEGLNQLNSGVFGSKNQDILKKVPIAQRKALADMCAKIAYLYTDTPTAYDANGRPHIGLNGIMTDTPAFGWLAASGHFKVNSKSPIRYNDVDNTHQEVMRNKQNTSTPSNKRTIYKTSNRGPTNTDLSNLTSPNATAAAEAIEKISTLSGSAMLSDLKHGVLDKLAGGKNGSHELSQLIGWVTGINGNTHIKGDKSTLKLNKTGLEQLTASLMPHMGDILDITNESNPLAQIVGLAGVDASMNKSSKLMTLFNNGKLNDSDPANILSTFLRNNNHTVQDLNNALFGTGSTPVSASDIATAVASSAPVESSAGTGGAGSSSLSSIISLLNTISTNTTTISNVVDNANGTGGMATGGNIANDLLSVLTSNPNGKEYNADDMSTWSMFDLMQRMVAPHKSMESFATFKEGAYSNLYNATLDEIGKSATPSVRRRLQREFADNPAIQYAVLGRYYKGQDNDNFTGLTDEMRTSLHDWMNGKRGLDKTRADEYNLTHFAARRFAGTMLLGGNDAATTLLDSNKVRSMYNTDTSLFGLDDDTQLAIRKALISANDTMGTNDLFDSIMESVKKGGASVEVTKDVEDILHNLLTAINKVIPEKIKDLRSQFPTVQKDMEDWIETESKNPNSRYKPDDFANMRTALQNPYLLSKAAGPMDPTTRTYRDITNEDDGTLNKALFAKNLAKTGASANTEPVDKSMGFFKKLNVALAAAEAAIKVFAAALNGVAQAIQTYFAKKVADINAKTKFVSDIASALVTYTGAQTSLLGGDISGGISGMMQSGISAATANIRLGAQLKYNKEQETVGYVNAAGTAVSGIPVVGGLGQSIANLISAPISGTAEEEKAYYDSLATILEKNNEILMAQYQQVSSIAKSILENNPLVKGILQILNMVKTMVFLPLITALGTKLVPMVTAMLNGSIKIGNRLADMVDSNVDITKFVDKINAKVDDVCDSMLGEGDVNSIGEGFFSSIADIFTGGLNIFSNGKAAGAVGSYVNDLFVTELKTYATSLNSLVDSLAKNNTISNLSTYIETMLGISQDTNATDETNSGIISNMQSTLETISEVLTSDTGIKGRMKTVDENLADIQKKYCEVVEDVSDNTGADLTGKNSSSHLTSDDKEFIKAVNEQSFGGSTIPGTAEGTDLLGKTADLIAGGVNGVVEFAQDPIGGLQNGYDKTAKVLGDGWEDFKGLFKKKKATGGKISATPLGRDMIVNGLPVTVAEAGQDEYLIPEAKMGGITINFTGNVYGMNDFEKQVTKIVNRATVGANYR